MGHFPSGNCPAMNRKFRSVKQGISSQISGARARFIYQKWSLAWDFCLINGMSHGFSGTAVIDMGRGDCSCGMGAALHGIIVRLAGWILLRMGWRACDVGRKWDGQSAIHPCSVFVLKLPGCSNQARAGAPDGSGRSLQGSRNTCIHDSQTGVHKVIQKIYARVKIIFTQMDHFVAERSCRNGVCTRFLKIQFCVSFKLS